MEKWVARERRPGFRWMVDERREPEGAAVVFYDGECGFCAGRVGWLLKRDRRRRLRFAPLQGALAARILKGTGLRENPSTLVLVTRCMQEGQRVHVRSGAVARIAARLPLPWKAGWLLLGLPRRWRDALYDAVARRRHQLRSAACALPAGRDERFFP